MQFFLLFQSQGRHQAFDGSSSSQRTPRSKNISDSVSSPRHHSMKQLQNTSTLHSDVQDGVHRAARRKKKRRKRHSAPDDVVVPVDARGQSNHSVSHSKYNHKVCKLSVPLTCTSARLSD